MIPSISLGVQATHRKCHPAKCVMPSLTRPWVLSRLGRASVSSLLEPCLENDATGFPVPTINVTRALTVCDRFRLATVSLHAAQMCGLSAARVHTQRKVECSRIPIQAFSTRCVLARQSTASRCFCLVAFQATRQSLRRSKPTLAHCAGWIWRRAQSPR
eukprot:scaffold250750_cov30-Tisochrysis_lutea.AAC.4